MQAAVEFEVKKVCPIYGISFGRLDDKATWRIDYEEEATEGQKEAARQVLEAFVWDDEMKEKVRKDSRDFQYSSELIYRLEFVKYVEANPGATFSEFMDYLETLRV